MPELVQVQRVFKVILHMEMARIVIPPALRKHKHVGGRIRRKREGADPADLPPRNFGTDIDGIFAAVIPCGIRWADQKGPPAWTAQDKPTQTQKQLSI